MLFGHSTWSERRLRKQILKQSRRRHHKSKNLLKNLAKAKSRVNFLIYDVL